MKKAHLPNNVRNPNQYGNNIIFEITNKAGDKVRCESFQERKLALLLQRDPKVVNYISQPFTHKYYDSKGNLRSYTPDFLAICLGCPNRIYEVSMTWRMELKPDLKERIVGGQQLAAETNRTFHLYDENVLPNDTETANLLVFYGAETDRAANHEVAEKALKYLAKNGSTHMSILSQAMQEKTKKDAGIVNLALRHMIWRGELEIDWNKLFYLVTQATGKRYAPTAFVWIPGGNHA